MLSPETAQKLKDNGFPQDLDEGNFIPFFDKPYPYEPTLPELIAECHKIVFKTTLVVQNNKTCFCSAEKVPDLVNRKLYFTAK